MTSKEHPTATITTPNSTPRPKWPYWIGTGGRFPSEISGRFHRNAQLVDAISNDRDASLARMREAMLTGPFVGAFFIGGMEGVEEEFAMFSRIQPGFPAFPIASTGAAAAKLFNASPELQRDQPELRDEISYLTLMRNLFAIAQSTNKPPAGP